MKIEKITNRNIMFKYDLTDWDLNLHLILGENRNYIIDTGLGSGSVASIKEYLGNDKKPIIIINTHYHWDHIWGNNCFCDNIIISHGLCRELITKNWDDMLNKSKEYINGDVKLCLPNLTFEDSLYFPDDEIKIFYTPGHTIDSISIFDEKDKILNTGDNIGDTMDEIVPSLNTDKDIFIKTIHKYKQLDVKTCISGHNSILGNEVFDKILQSI